MCTCFAHLTSNKSKEREKWNRKNMKKQESIKVSIKSQNKAINENCVYISM